MAHAINGFIGLATHFADAARTLTQARICPLHLGFAFLPLTDFVAPPDDASSEHTNLIRLTQPAATWAAGHSKRFSIAYVETEYFGGTGAQAAIVWQAGSVLFGPIQTSDSVPLLNGAINLAVRQLGVLRGQSIDGFAALGLNRYRSNEDWVAAVGTPVA